MSSDQWAPLPSIHRWGSNPPWHHTSLTSADGYQVSLDFRLGYQEYRGGAVFPYAHQLWVHVDHPDGEEIQEARVVFVAVSRDFDGSYLEQVSYLDLEELGDHEASGVIWELYLGLVRFEMAIVVNGKWLVDPVSGSHNFQP